MNTLTDYQIRAYLQSKLTAEEFIGVNQAEVAAALGIRKATVCESLRRLSEIGILVAGPKAGRSRTYKLRRELADWEKPMLRNFKQPVPPKPQSVYWLDALLDAGFGLGVACGVVFGVIGILAVSFFLSRFS